MIFKFKYFLKNNIKNGFNAIFPHNSLQQNFNNFFFIFETFWK